ncbi:MAG: hypothetical protein AAB414_00875 [Patescibacteria group bacterium]
MALATLNQTNQKAPEIKVGPNTPGLIHDGREQDFEREPNNSPIPEIFERAFDPVISGLGGVATEAKSAIADLFNIARGAETPLVNTPSQGSIENFNQPHGLQMKPEAAVDEARRIINEEARKGRERLASTETAIAQASKANEMLHQSVREVAGMDDAELARVSKYNNEDYRGINLRSRRNMLDAIKNFFQDLFNKSQEKATTFFQVSSKRTSSKAAVSGTGESEALYNQNAVDGQGILNSTRGAG